MKLRENQDRAKSLIYSAINSGKKRIVVQAPCAFGKTLTAASIIQDIASRGKGAIFAVPMITLANQSHREFKSFGIEAGVIQNHHQYTDYSKPVQVATIQSIRAMKKKYPIQWREFQQDKVLIIDEAHVLHETHREIMDLSVHPVIGLTATPWKKGMASDFDDLIVAETSGSMIEQGYLSQYKAYGLSAPDLKGIGVNAAGDYNAKQSGEKYDHDLVADIVETWKKLGENQKTILFAPRVVDAERFAKEFNDAGISAKSVSGYMDREDVAEVVEAFRRGEFKILCSVAMLTMGFDVPDIGCMIDAQPTKSLMRHVQKMGRVLRIAGGKDYAIILDHAGNVQRNGMPDDDYPTSLNDGINNETDRRKAEDPLPKKCPSCNSMKPPKVHKCPNCGFAPEKKSELEVAQGELVELTKTQKINNRTYTRQQKAELVAGLRFYARKKGYKEGWVSHKFREKMGVWPTAFRDVKPSSPVKWVSDHITHINIKAARSA